MAPLSPVKIRQLGSCTVLLQTVTGAPELLDSPAADQGACRGMRDPRSIARRGYQNDLETIVRIPLWVV